MAFETGKKLGSYEIVSFAGSGGMGEVYRARDMRLGRDIAIKVLPESLASDPNRLARFEQEARTVAVLNHPNIVVLHSIEESGGVRFLTMELVDGETLDHLIVPGGLPLKQMLELSITLADALAAAHKCGVVHRDLKPANIMVTRDGRVKVLDFGLAKLSVSSVTDDREETRDTPPNQLQLSRAGQVLGTVPYMAPEQWRGQPADQRTDIFSLGIIMYELITGQRPFTGSTSADVGSSVLRDPVPPLQAVRPDAPSDLTRIISLCLEKDRSRRMQTAEDVRNELELVKRLLELAPSTLTRTSASYLAGAAQELLSIAVLPFVNRSRDEEDEYFADGLADELLNLLTKMKVLRVAARTSSFSFKDKHEEVAVIGQKLNVVTLLEGSVRKAGNRVRITVQLVKVSDGFQLWSETYDRTLDDIFAVQDDIAHSVVKELRATLLGEMPDSGANREVRAAIKEAARGRTENTEAYRLFLQGRFQIDRYNRESMEKGVEYLQQALELEPHFALAWAQLSRALHLQATAGWIPLGAGCEEARAAALRAIDLAPDLAEGYVRLAMVQSDYDWNWQEANRSVHRAQQISPEHPAVQTTATNLAMTLGHLDRAQTIAREMIERDPLSPTAYSLYARASYYAGHLEEALAALHKALELNPHRAMMHIRIAFVLAALGRFDEAITTIEKEPEQFARLQGQACLHYRAGRSGKSEEVLRQLIDECGDRVAYQIAQVCATRGERDRAFDWLERAYALRDTGLIDMMCDPELSSLRDDSRWVPFLKKMRLAD